MFKHYIRIALINIKKEKFYSSLNILGLAIGFACFIIIALFIQKELEYGNEDTTTQNIYRVGKISHEEGNDPNEISTYTPSAFTEYLNSGLPWVEKATCFTGNWNGLISNRKNAYDESDIFLVDSNFFEVFDIQFIYGSAAGFMNQKNVILTESISKKYFRDINPVGKELLWGNDPYLITGVVPDPEEFFRFQYNIFFPISILGYYEKGNWGNNSFATYFKASDKFQAQLNLQEFNQHHQKMFIPQIISYFGITEEACIAKGYVDELIFEKYSDLYLYSKGEDSFNKNGRIQFIYVFGIIGILLILLASINYINLSIAKSVKRLREVALRKSIGASKKQIVRQYLIESVLVSLGSFIIGLVLVELTIPFFNNLNLQKIEFSQLFHSGLLLQLLGFAILVGLISGSFPAFVLSKFNTIDGLKGVAQGRVKGKWFKRALVLVQLVISFIILSSTFLINRQLDYLINKDLGFNKEHILYICNANRLFRKAETSKQELMKNPNIKSVSFSRNLLGQTTEDYSVQIEGRSSDLLYNVDFIHADEDYLETFGITLLQGRNFQKGLGSDSLALIVNETFIKKYKIENPLETTILDPIDDEGTKIRYRIIGVVKDYHYQDLYNLVFPMAIMLRSVEWEDKMFIKLSGQDIQSTIDYIEKYWQETSSDIPFSYSFASKQFSKLYDTEQNTKAVFTVFAFITIIIACLGLIGLVSYTSLLKKKEIGVRKVNGASIAQIAYLLSKETILITSISILVAIPVNIMLMQMWLDNFAYSIPITALQIIIPGILLLAISSLSEAFVIITTARQNPVRALRYE